MPRLLFFEHGVPAANIEVKAFGDEQNLTDDEVKEAVQQNPELSADGRQKLLKNIHSDYPGRQSARRHRAQSVKCNENATPRELVKYTPSFPRWACSSVGRAPALQAGGRGFESPHVHQNPLLLYCFITGRLGSFVAPSSPLRQPFALRPTALASSPMEGVAALNWLGV